MAQQMQRGVKNGVPDAGWRSVWKRESMQQQLGVKGRPWKISRRVKEKICGSDRV